MTPCLLNGQAWVLMTTSVDIDMHRSHKLAKWEANSLARAQKQMQNKTLAVEKYAKLQQKPRKENNTIEHKIKLLAHKYYGTTDVTQLSTDKLDKLIGWATGITPNKGKAQTNKYTSAKTQNKKYLNKNTKSSFQHRSIG